MLEMATKNPGAVMSAKQTELLTAYMSWSGLSNLGPCTQHRSKYVKYQFI